MDGLNPRQQAFVLGYLEHGNGTRAAMGAGYSEKTARAQASRLLTNAYIKAAIDKATRAATRTAKRTVEGGIYNFEALRDGAVAVGQYGAAVQAEANACKVSELYSDRNRDETDGIDPEAQIRKLCGGNSFAEQSLRLLLSGDVDGFMKIARPAGAPALVKDATA